MNTALEWFMASPEFWTSIIVIAGSLLWAAAYAAYAWGSARVARALAKRRAWPQRISVLLVALLLSGCATVRPDYYRPGDCLSLRQEGRRAGAVRTGAGYVATGLAAGGALAEAVADSKAATLSLAIAAVVAGAAGLSADYCAKDASREWEGACQAMPVPAAE